MPAPPQLALHAPGQPVQMNWLLAGTEQYVPKPFWSVKPPEPEAPGEVPELAPQTKL